MYSSTLCEQFCFIKQSQRSHLTTDLENTWNPRDNKGLILVKAFMSFQRFTSSLYFVPPKYLQTLHFFECSVPYGMYLSPTYKLTHKYPWGTRGKSKWSSPVAHVACKICPAGMPHAAVKVMPSTLLITLWAPKPHILEAPNGSGPRLLLGDSTNYSF